MEIFKDIPWYEWKYKISNLWNVKAINHRWKIWVDSLLYQWLSRWYKVVKLWSKKTASVHRLVASAFLWEQEWKEVNHKNWIKSDNRVENLEWCTTSENQLHSLKVIGNKNSFQNNHYKKWKFWEKSNDSKIVCRFTIDMKFIDSFFWTNEASRLTWVAQSEISRVCNNKRKTAWWFIWRYKDI